MSLGTRQRMWGPWKWDWSWAWRVGAECVRGRLECGDLIRMAAAGPLNLSGPFWPPPLPLSLLWPETGPPLLVHFSAQCLSSFPPSHPEVRNLGLPVQLWCSLLWVCCLTRFSHSLLCTSVVCSQASFSSHILPLCMVRLLVCALCSIKSLSFLSVNSCCSLMSFPPDSECALGTYLVFLASLAHQESS